MTTMLSSPDPSLYTVRAAIILDQDGHRLLAKYYDATFPSLPEQRAFEREIFQQTQRSGSEVLLIDGVTALCQRFSDITCYIVGGPEENELLLLTALTCVCDSLCHMLRKHVDRSSLLENMDTVCLILDEVIDQGVILESDSQQVIQRLSFKVLAEHQHGQENSQLLVEKKNDVQTVSEPAFGFVLFDYLLSGNGEQSEVRKEHT